MPATKRAPYPSRGPRLRRHPRALDWSRLYFRRRRGGGGRRDRCSFCHEGHHHARHRTASQWVRDRPILLADLTLAVYALPFFVGHYRWHGRLSQRRGRFRRARLRDRSRRANICPWAGRFRHRLAFDPSNLDCFRVRNSCSNRRLSAVLGLPQIGIPSLMLREGLAWIGAILIGGTAWARMTILAEPLPLTRGSGRCRLG